MLAHDGKVIVCAPRSLADKIGYSIQQTGIGSIKQYFGYRNMKENTGNITARDRVLGKILVKQEVKEFWS